MDDTEHRDNVPALAIGQIRELAAAIREVFGSNLTRVDLTDKRVIYFDLTDEEIVLLVAVYAKAERENMLPKDIRKVKCCIRFAASR